MNDRFEGDLLTGVGCFVTVATAGDADALLPRPGPGDGQPARPQRPRGERQLDTPYSAR